MTASTMLDSLSRAYVELAFGIERHIAGIVDAYTGPEEIKAAALAAPMPEPAALLSRAEELLATIAVSDLPESRADYLTAQVRALATLCHKLTGPEPPYRNEVKLCFDIEPERTPETVYDEALAALNEALPGSGDVAQRMIAWKQQFEIPVSTAETMVARIAGEARQRTAAFVPLPDGETIEYAFVSDKPWSGYNWYLGDGRSRVEFNTDLPIRANALLDLICHEGYPGHHAEHAIKEQRLYRELGYGEHAIQLINTPECVISEGIATLAASIIFPSNELERWQAEHVFAPLGVPADPERSARIREAQRALRSVSGNVALLVHEDGASEADALAYLRQYGLSTEEEARQRLRFITDPLWRAYVFTYHVGRDLLDAWLDVDDGEDVAGESAFSRRQRRFRVLLESQITPSLAASHLEQGDVPV